MQSKSKAKAPKKQQMLPKETDDFVSVARRHGADEDKKRFEAKLGKIARAKPQDAK
jgi:hypothetical protein